jgi:hypothetical protein
MVFIGLMKVDCNTPCHGCFHVRGVGCLWTALAVLFLKPVDDVQQVFVGVTFVFKGEHASYLKDGGFGFPVEVQQAIAGSVVLFCGSASVDECLDDGQ